MTGVVPHDFPTKNNIFNVRNFGASGRKHELATVMIQTAIDECAKAGGGMVYFPPGEYLSGPVSLRSHIHLYLEAGATLFASRNMKDYIIEAGYKADQQPSGMFKTTFLRAEHIENISITGQGTIDGQAEQVWEPLAEVDKFIEWETENARRVGIPMERAYQKDPKVRLVYLMFSNNIFIQGVTIKDSPDWNLHLGRCRDVKITAITVKSSLTHGVNSDGIDIDACKNVLVSGCIIETGDDAICLKSTLLDGVVESCENIIVDNCICTSTSTALKLGTESHGNFKNILFNNCVIPDTNRGLSIVVRDGATVSNVKFSNIVMHCSRMHFNWWGNGDPIWLVVLKRNSNSRIGKIHDVVFENITASGEGTSKIEGFANSPLENIHFRNVKIKMNFESLPDKRAINGFEAHDVTKLTLKDCEMTWDEKKPEPLWGSAFALNRINQLELFQISGKQSPLSSKPAILLNDIREATVEDCYAPTGTETFLKIKGQETQAVQIVFNNTFHAGKAIEIDESVKKGAVMMQTAFK